MRGGASTILPGLNSPVGSNVRLTVRNASYRSGPNIRSMNGPRTSPSPCSPERRAAELQHQLGDVVGDRLEPAHPRRRLHVDDGAHVQAADRGVRVDAGGAAVALHDVQEPGDVVAQPRRRHRGVLNERDALRVALHRHRQPQRRLPQAPDAGLGGRVGRPGSAAGDAPRREVLFDGAEAAGQLGRIVRVELHAEQGAGRLVALQHRPAQRVEGGALAGVVEDEAVHHLDRRRPVLEDRGGGPEGVEEVVELDGQHRLGVGQRHQVHPRLDDEAEGATPTPRSAPRG